MDENSSDISEIEDENDMDYFPSQQEVKEYITF